MLGLLLALVYYDVIHPMIVLRTGIGYTVFMTTLLTAYSWLLFDIDSQIFYITYVLLLVFSKKSRAV